MARLYVYRNLHKKTAFSVRLRGKVVAHLENFIAYDVTFKVSELGRLRVLTNRQRNVHAYVAATQVRSIDPINTSDLRRVSYNPWKAKSFMLGDEPIFKAKAVVFCKGQCYLLEGRDTIYDEHSADI